MRSVIRCFWRKPRGVVLYCFRVARDVALLRQGKGVANAFLQFSSIPIGSGFCAPRGVSMSGITKTVGRRVSRPPSFALKVKVEGPGVHRKSIAIPDLVKICEAIQSAVHRQAEAMQSPAVVTLRRGPITASAQEECTLELVGISGGSTGLIFRYAKPQQHLPIPEAPNFGSDVIARIAETVKEFGGRKRALQPVDPGVLDSLKELGAILQKKRITRISLNVPRQNGKRKSVKAVLTAAVSERIAARVKVPTHERLSIEGKLEMADFKETGKMCRIHPPIGVPLQCSFDPEFEDQVYMALRKPARVTGQVRLNPITGRPEELKIENIEILEELLLGAKDFFASQSLDQLAHVQGVSALANPKDLAGGWPEDENLDEFLSETYTRRG